MSDLRVYSCKFLIVSVFYSYESMVKALERQKPSSKKDILAALDKVRPNLPVKPLPKSKQQAPILTDEPKAVKGVGVYL